MVNFISIKRHLLLFIYFFFSCSLSIAWSQFNVKATTPASKLNSYEKRVQLLRTTPGLAAFWDFVLREDGTNGVGKFKAYTAQGDDHSYILEPINISREFWKVGDSATMADFPLLGYGPFGQAVQFKSPKNINDLPVLMVPRHQLHDTPIDVKGSGQSVSMLVWMVYQTGNHAIAGIWHEGTDSPPAGIPAEIKLSGQRQYGMFAGLSANSGSASVHVSENGLASFGDHYARHLASTKEKIRKVPASLTDFQADSCWSVVGFVYDNQHKTVTAYLNGVTTNYWIGAPEKHSFYKYAANAWKQAKLSKMEGLQEGEDVNFPMDQYYTPPEDKVLRETVVYETKDERIVIRDFEFTKVKYVLKKDNLGKFSVVSSVQLLAIQANPYYFGHDIYSPVIPAEGAPFTIGRVIHSNRHATLSAYFGGVAVFNKALSSNEMNQLSKIGRTAEYPVINFNSK